jgi:putative membrane protein
MHAVVDAFAAPVFAHGLATASVSHWELEPLVVLPLAAALLVYGLGLFRLWRKAGVGRGIPGWSAASFVAGWAVIAAALVSPVAWLSQILFSVHMTQHMLLMLLAAPLLTFGQPMLVWMWALRRGGRLTLVRHLRAPRAARTWQMLTAPLAVFVLQAAVLWLWHIPAWYEAALRHDGIHALEHLSLVVGASLFWWGMVHGRYGRMGYGLGVVYVFLTAVHSSVLGALVTVSPSVWYGTYGRSAAAWHVDPLEDQQLAGLLMWIPAGLLFIVFGLALAAAWLGEAERRVRFGATDAAARRLLLVLLLAGLMASSACEERAVREAEAVTGGSVHRGETAIGKYGCGTCHTIPRIRAANATVGPPLDRMGARMFLGGHLTNTPANLMLWIQRPQTVDPRNAMPDLGVTDQDVKDIAAFLYTLR